MSNIRQIFSEDFGFNTEDKLNSLARILYYFEFNGIQRSPDPSPSDLNGILDQKISRNDLNDLLQKNIFQKIRGTKERQQIDPSNAFSDDIKQQLMQDFKNIGFVDEISPSPEKDYKSVIIFGATQKGMEIRFDDFFNHFLPQINQGGKEIFVLAGEREGWLDSEIFAKKILLDRINSSLENKGESKKTMESLQQEIDAVYANPAFHSLAEKRKGAVEHFQKKYEIKFPTETDIAREIYESNKVNFGDCKITFINAEKNPDGSRPNTEDTLKAFKEHIASRDDISPDKIFSILSISNQPHVTAQSMAIKSAGIDVNRFYIDTVGKSSSEVSLNLFVVELCGALMRSCKAHELTASKSPSTSLVALRTEQGENATRSQSRVFFKEKDETLKKFRKFIHDSLKIPLPILNLGYLRLKNSLNGYF